MKFMSRMRSKKLFAIVVAIGTSILILLGGHHMSNKTEFVTIPASAYSNTQATTTVKARSMQVQATAYHGDPITSTGTKPRPYHTIAVDPTVIPYGTKVYIPEFDKVFVAEDCGSAIKNHRIDIYMNNHNECIQWGRRTITIYIIQE